MNYIIQTEPVIGVAPLADAKEITEHQEENVQFEEEKVTASFDASGQLDDTFNLHGDDTASIARFLERPVKLHAFTWNEGDGFSTSPPSIRPWYLYFNNTFMKNKLSNFSRLRCKLKLTFRFNASPFYYGSMRACYDPMSTGKFDPLIVPDLISISQMPGVYIEPQEGTSVEMILPFLWPLDWFDTQSKADMEMMGKIFFMIYAPLRSATGVSGSGITVTTYAQAIDVELAGPTLKPILQSGIISGPASAVATAANSYVSHAKIGPYAKAVKVGATMVASIAKTFGFSNAPVMEDVKPFQNKVFHAFANTETSMPIDKLALDPNNEVVLDNTVAGIDPVDELDILSIVTRPSYIGAIDWTNSDAADARICYGKVSPSMFFPTSYTGGTYYNPTPMGWVAEMFRYWRGGIRYYFKVVRSKYQKGRLMFQWDPNGIIDHPNIETAVFTKVFDLSSEEQGFEVIIPYKAAAPWMKVSNVYFFGNVPPTYGRATTNGCWSMAVINPLTGPDLSNTVTILAYCNACDDMEFSAPRALPQCYATTIQSKPFDGGVISNSSKVNDFTVGESVKSLRVLLHRTSLSITQRLGPSNTRSGIVPGDYHVANMYNVIPPEPGYATTTTGLNRAISAVDTVTVKPANWSKMHPLNWILTAFVGYRGSVNVHAVVHSNGILENLNSLSITRTDHSPIINSANAQKNSMYTVSALTLPFDYDSTIVDESNAIGIPYIPSGAGGMTVTHGRTQMALSANIPQYCQARFWLAWHKQRNALPLIGDAYDGFRVDADFSVPETTSATTIHFPTVKLYWSAGVDFNTVFFTGVPRLQKYDMIPVST